MIQLRLFVSSPSDVQAERACVDLVTARLNGELEGIAAIETVRWETGFYTADRSFQEAIDSAIDDMRSIDIAICILWKRVGSELNPHIWQRADGSAYESGTVLEVETAVELSRGQDGGPDVYLFRKRAPISYGAETFEAERLQHQLLESVWRRWTATAEGHNAAGHQNFDGPDDFERQVELCLRQWLERKGVVVKTVWDRTTKGSPFRGLAAFEVEHAPVFFGRDVAIARALAKLRQSEEAGTPFLTIVGASGSGKSSLLRAGLMPHVVRPGIIPGIDAWRSALVVPSGDPLVSLAAAVFAEDALGGELRAGDFNSPELLAQCLAGGSTLAVAPIRAALDRAARQRAETLHHAEPRPVRLLIAIDQVERIFVETHPDKAAAFADIIRALVEGRLATALVSLRSDAYAAFQQIPGFAVLLEHEATVYNLRPPTAQELEDIVVRPIEACHPPLVFEAAAEGRSLAETIVADTKGGDALPLLQMTLHRLYEAARARGDGVLRFADYPGIDEAVARTAGDAVAELDADARAELPALLTELVGDVAHDSGTGAQPIIVPLDRRAFTRGLAARDALIDAFIEHRLLTTEREDGRDLVRPTHDALLRAWPEAVAIIAESAAIIRVRHTLEPIAEDWSAAAEGTKASYLATSPALLAGAENLLARFGDDLTPAMRGFITASLAADAARRTAERRRQRRLLTATAGGLVVATLLAGLAGWQWSVADLRKKEAERSLDLATQTANGLIYDLAQKFRNRGLPADTVRGILEQARKLQEQLAAGGTTSPALRRSQAAALAETADTSMALGDTEGALGAARRSHDILKALASSDPDNGDIQRELRLSDDKIGNALAAHGDLAAALASYREGLDIAKALTRKDPANTVWQRDLAVTYDRIGDILEDQNDFAGALAAYRDALPILKALSLKEPDKPEWQRNLLGTDQRIGDVLRAQGDLAGALAAHRESLDIAKSLALKDPDNTEWQRDLSLGNASVGNVLLAQGDAAGALAAFRNGLAIAKALALKDPDNAQWQHDLAVSDGKVGDVLLAQGDFDGALADYGHGLAIAKALTVKDPGNAEWQRNLFASYGRLGFALSRRSDFAGALAAFTQAEAVALHLKEMNATSATSASDLAWIQARIEETRRKLAAGGN